MIQLVQINMNRCVTASRFLKRYLPEPQPQNCSSPVLKSWIGDLQFRIYKKPSIYGDDFLSQGMSVLYQYFHFVSTKCNKMNKILDIFIYLKYNKTNLKTPFKSQDGNKYFQLNFIDYILTPFRVPSKFVLQHVTAVFKCIFITCTYLFLIYIENFRI